MFMTEISLGNIFIQICSRSMICQTYSSWIHCLLMSFFPLNPRPSAFDSAPSDQGFLCLSADIHAEMGGMLKCCLAVHLRIKVYEYT